jgi:threonine/homoserine/homoserine lactone efflux protein
MTLAAFVAAWFVHLLAAASPGPAILMAARTGVTEGLRTGMFLAVGIGAGALVWAVAALFGLSVLFQAAPALLWGFKILGGLFLCWIAWQMWAHATEPLDLNHDDGRPPRTAWSAFRLGLTTQLANPKPAVFFGAVFVGTVPPGTSPFMIGLLLCAVFLNELFCATVVARAFSFDRPRAAYARLKTTIDRSFGGILALLGVKIATT